MDYHALNTVNLPANTDLIHVEQHHPVVVHRVEGDDGLFLPADADEPTV